MPKLIAFTSISLDGYFTSLNGDMSWAHADPSDAEWNAFVAGNTKGESMLVFGRVTYDMMASCWPTPMATQQNGEVPGNGPDMAILGSGSIAGAKGPLRLTRNSARTFGNGNGVLTYAPKG